MLVDFALQKKTMLLLAVITGLFVTLYSGVIGNLFSDWANNPDYSHGYLIPLIALYLVWTKREVLAKAHPSYSYWGLLIVILGLIQLFLGEIGAEQFLQSTSMILVIIGIVVFLWGLNTLRVTLVPTLYLLFMIPLPATILNTFAFSLKQSATALAAFFIEVMGVAVLRQGNVLVLPVSTLEVADACSGLRSVMSLLALSVLLCLLSRLSLWKKLVLVMAALPVAIASNVVRLTLIALLLMDFGIDITHGIYHTLSGVFVSFIGLVIFAMIYKLLSILPGESRKPGGEVQP